MEISSIHFWLGLGVTLVIAEVILPGLVSIFIGFGALTVAVFLHYQYIQSVPGQLITWFLTSTLYIFSLRLMVMKYYPMDTVKEDIDEDHLVIGKEVEAVEDIPAGGMGRISYSETTWQAKSMDDVDIKSGEMVRVLKRDNITWFVERANKEK